MPGRPCSICQHPARTAIDKALVEGAAFSKVAAKYRVSEDALGRHKAAHVPAKLAKAEEAKAVDLADDLLAQVKQLRNKAIAILIKAEDAGDLRTALLGIREARACVELLGEMEGELNRRPQFNLYLSAEWIEVRAHLMTALSDFPEARAAAAMALRGMHDGNG